MKECGFFLTIQIGAKKQIGEMRGMICEDCRVRHEFGQLLKFIVSGRPFANAYLYGSEPPPSGSVCLSAMSISLLMALLFVHFIAIF